MIHQLPNQATNIAINTYHDGYEAKDDTLIAAIGAGDSNALALLYERYMMRIYRRGLRILGSPELAEDLVQEVFWRVWKHSRSFAGDQDQVINWLYRITTHACIDELRRRRRYPAVVAESIAHELIAEHIDEQSDVLDLVCADEQRQMIFQALAQLPIVQRNAIILVYFNGMSCRQIADIYQQPLGTIKTRVRRGLKKLGRLLQYVRQK